MGRFLWLNWSGGGNLPPSLGIARALTERGHTVTFAGRPEMVPRVDAAGFDAIEVTRAYEQVAAYPPASRLREAGCYLSSPAVAEELRAIVAREAPDVVLIDAMFPAALAEAATFTCRTAVILHTFLFRQYEMWRGQVGQFIEMRRQAGYGELPPFDALWRSQDRLVATALAEFDHAPLPGWEFVRYAGPVLEDERVAVPVALPWAADDRTPLVLVSFSTGLEQRNVQKLQATLDALGALDVHAVATTGGIVEPDELRVPPNAFVVRYAAHDPIMARASLIVTHGGHGTAMRALRHGVPMILIPGLAGDQPFVAAAVEEWGAGLALPKDAAGDAIRAAARAVFTEPRFAEGARRRADALRGVDGAPAAADHLEALLAATPA